MVAPTRHPFVDAVVSYATANSAIAPSDVRLGLNRHIDQQLGGESSRVPLDTLCIADLIVAYQLEGRATAELNPSAADFAQTMARLIRETALARGWAEETALDADVKRRVEKTVGPTPQQHAEELITKWSPKALAIDTEYVKLKNQVDTAIIDGKPARISAAWITLDNYMIAKTRAALESRARKKLESSLEAIDLSTLRAYLKGECAGLELERASEFLGKPKNYLSLFSNGGAVFDREYIPALVGLLNIPVLDLTRKGIFNANARPAASASSPAVARNAGYGMSLLPAAAPLRNRPNIIDPSTPEGQAALRGKPLPNRGDADGEEAEALARRLEAQRQQREAERRAEEQRRAAMQRRQDAEARRRQQVEAEERQAAEAAQQRKQEEAVQRAAEQRQREQAAQQAAEEAQRREQEEGARQAAKKQQELAEAEQRAANAASAKPAPEHGSASRHDLPTGQKVSTDTPTDDRLCDNRDKGPVENTPTTTIKGGHLDKHDAQELYLQAWLDIQNHPQAQQIENATGLFIRGPGMPFLRMTPESFDRAMVHAGMALLERGLIAEPESDVLPDKDQSEILSLFQALVRRYHQYHEIPPDQSMRR